VAEGKIEVLEERSHTQREMIDQLMACVKNMEGKLCHCGKGRDHQVLGEVSVLDSPLVLGLKVPKDTGSDDSYHTPPIASSSIGPSSSLANANKENALIIYNSRASLLQKIEDKPIKNAQPLPVPAPVLDSTSVSRFLFGCGMWSTCHLLSGSSSIHLPSIRHLLFHRCPIYNSVFVHCLQEENQCYKAMFAMQVSQTQVTSQDIVQICNKIHNIKKTPMHDKSELTNTVNVLVNNTPDPDRGTHGRGDHDDAKTGDSRSCPNLPNHNQDSQRHYAPP